MAVPARGSRITRTKLSVPARPSNRHHPRLRESSRGSAAEFPRILPPSSAAPHPPQVVADRGFEVEQAVQNIAHLPGGSDVRRSGSGRTWQSDGGGKGVDSGTTADEMKSLEGHDD